MFSAMRFTRSSSGSWSQYRHNFGSSLYSDLSWKIWVEYGTGELTGELVLMDFQFGYSRSSSAVVKNLVGDWIRM